MSIKEKSQFYVNCLVIFVEDNRSGRVWLFYLESHLLKSAEAEFMRILGIILRVLRLEISVWISYNIWERGVFLSGFPSFLL
jgi:hypothetical protein